MWKTSCGSSATQAMLTGTRSSLTCCHLTVPDPLVVTWKTSAHSLKRCPSLLVLGLAAQGSSKRYPLIFRGPQEQLNLLPIFWKKPLKGDFFIVTSRLPILFLVS